MKETYHRERLANFSEIKAAIVQALEKTDFLHIQSLNEELESLSRGQLLCALDAMEREGSVKMRKQKTDLYVSLA